MTKVVGLGQDGGPFIRVEKESGDETVKGNMEAAVGAVGSQQNSTAERRAAEELRQYPTIPQRATRGERRHVQNKSSAPGLSNTRMGGRQILELL